MAAWSESDVAANGIRLHYARTGGAKPPLVLAHGITDNGLCWTHVAQGLEADFDVIMYDARGHGLSEAPPDGYDPATRAADLAALIEALGLDRPALMGHSMGADTIAVAAASYPSLARCIVLVDPPWRPEAPLASAEEQQARAEQWRAGILANRAKSRDELIAQCRAQSPSWPEVELGPWADSKRQVSPNVVGVVAALRNDWREIVPRIVCPILLVTGDPERGAIVTAETAAQAAALWRSGQVAHISGAGHSIQREQYEPFMRAVRAFLLAR